jgi:hypothetical protein
MQDAAASTFSFKKRMSTESQLLLWKGEGLPADDLSQVCRYTNLYDD